MQIEVKGIKKQFKVPIKSSGAFSNLRQLLWRDFKTIDALSGIDFNVGEGELIGYLGPNGAGKSTTIKILTGILVPDSGSVTINGNTPWLNRQSHVADIGVVFGQKSQLWWDLPLSDSFELLKAIYRIPDKTYKAQWEWLVSGMGIGSYIHQPVRQLSLGQRMRAELVASLLHLPKLLFLDEPTIGLDATSKQQVREFILTLNEKYGTTVILTTHDMDDIESLCKRVMVIDQGLLAFDGTLNTLRKRVYNKRRLTLDYDGILEANLSSRLVESSVEIHSDKSSHGKLILEFDPECYPPHDLLRDISSGISIRDLLIENPPIEEIIQRLYSQYQSQVGGSDGI